MNEDLPLEEVSGLDPTVWIIVGGGYAREEVKNLFFEKRLGLTASAVTSLEDLALRILGIDSKRVLDSPARQEVLRLLLGDHRVIAQLPEIRGLRRQSGFLRKLDQAIQQGRLAFAHPEECLVLHERLSQRRGSKNVLREELMQLSLAFETWLGVQQFWDPPLLLRHAAQVLDQRGWPEKIGHPERIHFLNAHKLESAHLSFLESLQRKCEMIRSTLSAELPAFDADSGRSLSWERWHTLDDACDALADRVCEIGKDAFSQVSVLIPDLPPLRRSLVRALRERDIPLAEPRDPSRLKWDEEIKLGLLPLELVAARFERGRLLAWISSPYCAHSQEVRQEWIKELNARAFRLGKENVQGEKLRDLRAELDQSLDSLFLKKTIEGWSQAHLEILGKWKIANHEFWEGLWAQVIEDLERVELGRKKWPLQLVLERLRTRLSEMSPPVEKEKPVEGLRIFRLQQAPIRVVPGHRLWILGLPPSWLSEESFGDYWWSVRDREVLCGEFAVRSALDVSLERTGILRTWMSESAEVVFWDAEIEWDGRERETLAAFFRQLGLDVPLEKCESKGAHPRWKGSFTTDFSFPPQSVGLPPETSAKPEVTATLLDRYSRCPFQALAYHRWNIRDLDDPEMELWPQVKGNLLHSAVRILLKTRSKNGQITLSAREAVERAWNRRPPEGLFRSQRVEKTAQERLIRVIERFLEKEREFVAHARTKSLSLEDLRFRWEFEEKGRKVAIVGEPDRIEENEDGILIADYKTSSSVPNGQEMVEAGYRLQLPFYALAAQRELKRRVIGTQFIELTSEGRRTNGIFFKKWNGKEEGKLSNLRSNSKSLFTEEPEDIWSRLEEVIKNQTLNYLDGKFDVKPARPEKECRSCMVADLCGIRRKPPGE